ncbi:MAG: amidase family protein, partial [Pseudomonadota bacterium]
GSRLAQGVTFDADTELMARCKRAGLVTVGTTTTPEMAFNASTEAVVYGPTRNPWNTDHSPGGSSGGAGAAVAAGMVPLAHANDGGGSIRIPAACNGLVGLKPSRGRTPTGPDSGIFLWGLAIEFVVTRTVRDAAALLDAVAGPDEGFYYTALPPKGSFFGATTRPSPRLKIGVLEQIPGCAAPEPEIKDRLGDTVRLLEELGHTCAPVSLEYDVDGFNASTIRLWGATIAHYIDLFAAGTGREIGPDTLEAVTLETYKFAKALSAVEMEWAMGVQNKICRSVAQSIKAYDVVLTPGLGQDVAKLGVLDQNASGVGVMDWWKQLMYAYTPYTPLFNTTGQPAIMLPLWQSKAGLPLGMQFVGRPSDEETLIGLATELEHAHPWAGRRPPLYA